MKKNKFITLVTGNTPFAFFYILAFIAVIFAAILTEGDVVWVKSSWVMLSILGIFISLTAYVSYEQASQSKRWPVVSAKLLSARVKSKSGSGSERVYSPVVDYTFSFNGHEYKGNTIDYSAMSGSEAWANKVINDIEKKSHALLVHVNPRDPEMNVLNPGARFVHLLRYIIGPAMIVFGIMAALDMIDFK